MNKLLINDKNKHFFSFCILSFILCIAILLRLYKITDVPPGLHPYEAEIGNQAIEILNKSSASSYSMLSFLHALLVAPFVKLFGNTTEAIRLSSVFFSIMSIIFTYIWSKDWFNRRTALLTALIMAIMPWSLFVSRIGHKSALVAMFLPLFLYFGGRAYKTGKLKFYIVSGILASLLIYSYLITLPIILTCIVFTFLKSDSKSISKLNKFIFLIVMTVLTLPLIFNLSTNGTFKNSVLNKTIFSSESSLTLFEKITKPLSELANLSFRGDSDSFRNLANMPILNGFVSLMLILGLIYCIINITKKRYLVMLLIFLSALLPAILAGDSIRNNFRIVTLLPITSLLAGIGINYLISHWYGLFKESSGLRAIIMYIVLLLFVFSGIESYKLYFVAYAQDTNTAVALHRELSNIADYYNSTDANKKTSFLITDKLSNEVVKYLTYDNSGYTLLDKNSLQSLPIDNVESSPRDFIVTTQQDGNNDYLDIIKLIQNKFKDTSLEKKTDKEYKDTIFYQLNLR